MSLPPSEPRELTGDLPEDGAARVVLFGRAACHLCAEAEQVIAAVCAEVGETYEVVDIDEEAGDERADEAGVDPDEIPVTFVDGAQHDFWRVDPDRLRIALARTPR